MRLARLAFIAACWAAGVLPAAAAVRIDSVRVWPADDYTRVTMESRQSIGHHLFTVASPDRLVLDLDDVSADQALQGLAGQVSGADPYIRKVRVARHKPGVVRVVLELKTPVRPVLTEQKPVGGYGYRLMLDIYPKTARVAAPESETAAGGAESADGGDGPGAAGNAVAAHEAARMRRRADAGADAEAPRRAAVPRRAPAHVFVVAVDAGHGGEDPGAHGVEGTHEKDVTLAIARKVKAHLDELPGVRAFLTRDGDYFIPLGGRVAKARKGHADLFVSIHADASPSPEAHGSSVFALSEHGATSLAARLLAKHENESDLIGGVSVSTRDPYLARTLLDLSQTATINDSLKLGRQVLKELAEINPLHSRQVEQAGFAVLKSADTPSILVETAFISNPQEERKLRDDTYRDHVARAIVAGIERFKDSLPPPPERLTSSR